MKNVTELQKLANELISLRRQVAGPNRRMKQIREILRPAYANTPTLWLDGLNCCRYQRAIIYPTHIPAYCRFLAEKYNFSLLRPDTKKIKLLLANGEEIEGASLETYFILKTAS